MTASAERLSGAFVPAPNEDAERSVRNVNRTQVPRGFIDFIIGRFAGASMVIKTGRSEELRGKRSCKPLETVCLAL